VRRVEVAGYAAVCLKAGEGPPLVVLASPLVRARTYLPLLRRLARHFRTRVVELPGSALALLLTACHPERVRGLVLAGAVGARRWRGVARVMGARFVDGLLDHGGAARLGAAGRCADPARLGRA
jgi:hypothetical protein